MKNRKYTVSLVSQEITVDGGFVCDVTGNATQNELAKAFIKIQDPFVQDALERNLSKFVFTEIVGDC